MSTHTSPEPMPLQESLHASGLLGWWYHLLAYHLPEGHTPTLHEHEVIRRSRLATFVLVVQLVLIEGPVIPVVAAAPNGHLILPWLLGCMAILLLAFLCNRLGQLTLAGLLMVASIEITVGLKILTIPGGLGVASLPQFDILIQPVLLAVVLLPPWSAFVVAGANSSFILLTLLAGPHAPDLAAALRNPALQGDIVAVPVLAQIIIATVAYLIVANLLVALKRASRAEQIAQLEYTIAESQRAMAARTQELEQGIEVLTRTIQSAASSRGPGARIILPVGHVLWPVLQQMWNFLDRYQRVRQAEAHLALTVQASTELIEALEAMRQGKPFQAPPRRNTPIDGISFALASLPPLSRGEHCSGPFRSASAPIVSHE